MTKVAERTMGRRAWEAPVTIALRNHVDGLIYAANLKAAAKAAGVDTRVFAAIRDGERQYASAHVVRAIEATTPEQAATTLAATRSPNSPVPTDDARRHVEVLKRDVPGVNDAIIADAAGVAPTAVEYVRTRPRVAKRTVDAVLATTVRDVIDALARAERPSIALAGPVREHLRTLVDSVTTGTHHIEDVVAASGVAATTVRNLLHRDDATMPRFVADKILATTVEDVARCTAYRTRKTSGYDRVPTAEVRAHVERIMADTGADMTAVGRAAGVNYAVVGRVLAGRPTMRREAAERLLAVKAEHVLRVASKVPADAARLHLATLFGNVPGLSPHALGEHTGIADGVIRRVLRMKHGDVLPRSTVDRILAVTIDDAHAAVRLHPNYRAVWITRTSQALGWSLTWQARFQGYRTNAPGWLSNNGPITHANMEAVERMRVFIADRVATPENSGQGRSGITRAKAEARKAGWHPPAAYDDDLNLIEDAIRTPVTERADALAEAHDEIARLDAAGYSANQIAAAVGMSTKAVERYRARKRADEATALAEVHTIEPMPEHVVEEAA